MRCVSWSAYLSLGAGEVAARAEAARRLLGPDRCRVCPRRFVAAELGTGTYMDLMAQYHPAGLVGRNQSDGCHEIDRQLARDEYELAAQYASELGLTRLDERSRASGLQRPRHQPRQAHDRHPPAAAPPNPRPAAAVPSIGSQLSNHRR